MNGYSAWDLFTVLNLSSNKVTHKGDSDRIQPIKRNNIVKNPIHRSLRSEQLGFPACQSPLQHKVCATNPTMPHFICGFLDDNCRKMITSQQPRPVTQVPQKCFVSKLSRAISTTIMSSAQKSRSPEFSDYNEYEYDRSCRMMRSRTPLARTESPDSGSYSESGYLSPCYQISSSARTNSNFDYYPSAVPAYSPYPVCQNNLLYAPSQMFPKDRKYSFNPVQRTSREEWNPNYVQAIPVVKAKPIVKPMKTARGATEVSEAGNLLGGILEEVLSISRSRTGNTAGPMVIESMLQKVDKTLPIIPEAQASRMNSIVTVLASSLLITQTNIASAERPKAYQAKTPRPENSFFLYRRSVYPRVFSQNPGTPNPTLSKMISQMWREEPQCVRDFFADLAERVKMEHKKLFPNYKYMPRRRKRKCSEIDNDLSK